MRAIYKIVGWLCFVLDILCVLVCGFGWSENAVSSMLFMLAGIIVMPVDYVQNFFAGYVKYYVLRWVISFVVFCAACMMFAD